MYLGFISLFSSFMILRIGVLQNSAWFDGEIGS